MRKSKFTEEQIIWFLTLAEAGIAVTESCRQGGFSDATLYKWRAKFGGTEASEAKPLRKLESVKAKLNHLLADAYLDMHSLNSFLGQGASDLPGLYRAD